MDGTDSRLAPEARAAIQEYVARLTREPDDDLTCAARTAIRKYVMTLGALPGVALAVLAGVVGYWVDHVEAAQIEKRALEAVISVDKELDGYKDQLKGVQSAAEELVRQHAAKLKDFDSINEKATSAMTTVDKLMSNITLAEKKLNSSLAIRQSDELFKEVANEAVKRPEITEAIARAIADSIIPRLSTIELKIANLEARLQKLNAADVSARSALLSAFKDTLAHHIGGVFDDGTRSSKSYDAWIAAIDTVVTSGTKAIAVLDGNDRAKLQLAIARLDSLGGRFVSFVKANGTGLRRINQGDLSGDNTYMTADEVKALTTTLLEITAEIKS